MKNQEQEKNIFLDLKDSLEDMRNVCFDQINKRMKMIENKESEIYKLVSQAEQVIMLQALEKQQKETNKSLYETLSEKKKKIKDLEKKFNNIED